jgi:hypothetical protein
MSIMNSDALKNNLNPSRGYLWEMVMPNPRGDGDSQTLTLRCMSASIPSRGFGKIHIPFKQTAGVEYAGKPEYDHTWNLRFVEGEDRAVFDAFYSWCQLIINDYAGTGVADPDYKSDMYLTLLTRADGTIYNKIKLIGCWPSKMNETEVGNDQEKEIQLQVVMNFDRWESANEGITNIGI